MMNDGLNSDREVAERALAIERELSGRVAGDAMRAWKPYPKQAEFVSAVLGAKSPECWFIAGNRAGKSEAGAYCGARLARYGLPDAWVRSNYSGASGDSIEVRDRATSGWVVALDHGMRQTTLGPKYFDNGLVSPGASRPFIPAREIARWLPEENILKLKNGSLIEFKSCESGAGKFQSAGKDWVHFDEVPPVGVYNEAGIRVEAGRRLATFGTATILPPEGVIGGVSWLYDKHIKRHKAGRLPPSECMLFGASIYDNPHLGRNEITALESRYPVDTPMGQIRLLGVWLPGISGTRAYPSFGPHHVIEQRQSNVAPLAWCWDFNVDPLVTEIGYRDGWMFRFTDEIVIEGSGMIDDMCEAFHARYANHRGEIWIYGDATGGSRSAATGSKTCYDLILSACMRMGLRVRKKVPEANPFVRDRLIAFNTALRGSDGVQRVEISSRCRYLIDDMEQVLLDSSGGIRKSSRAGDAYSARTHASDAAGYWIAYEAPVRFAMQGMRGSRVHNVRAPVYAFANR